MGATHRLLPEPVRISFANLRASQPTVWRNEERRSTGVMVTADLGRCNALDAVGRAPDRDGTGTGAVRFSLGYTAER